MTMIKSFRAATETDKPVEVKPKSPSKPKPGATPPLPNRTNSPAVRPLGKPCKTTGCPGRALARPDFKKTDIG